MNSSYLGFLIPHKIIIRGISEKSRNLSATWIIVGILSLMVLMKLNEIDCIQYKRSHDLNHSFYEKREVKTSYDCNVVCIMAYLGSDWYNSKLSYSFGDLKNHPIIDCYCVFSFN